MSESNKQKPPYGARFAEAWKLLQVYLADLDPSELEGMEKMGETETLSLLKMQPALGSAGALVESGSGAPEELAIAILRERLDTLERAVKPGANAPWGALFMRGWKAEGMPLSAFNYELIQSIKMAGKAETIKILRKNVQGIGSGKASWWDVNDPEGLAQKLGQAWRMRQMVFAVSFMSIV